MAKSGQICLFPLETKKATFFADIKKNRRSKSPAVLLTPIIADPYTSYQSRTTWSQPGP